MATLEERMTAAEAKIAVLLSNDTVQARLIGETRAELMSHVVSRLTGFSDGFVASGYAGSVSR